MKNSSFRMIPMAARHVASCAAIVSASEPWRTLREKLDFAHEIERGRAYVCLKDNVVAGFVSFTPDPVFARGGYLRALGVAPGLRRHGLGRRLLAFAEKTTAKKSPNFYLCVSSFNRPARRFYGKCGYLKVGKLDGLILKGASEYIYWKRLRKPR